MTNSIVAMVVKACGISVKEAEAIAEVENKEAESLYIDCVKAEAEEEEARIRWAEWDAEQRLAEEQESEFFRKYIEGKSYDELDPDDYSFWSDLYKDAHGFRPRWYLQSLYEAKVRAEKKAVREDLEDDGWIMLDGYWCTYERQLEGFDMTLWLWDNHGRTFERMEAEIRGEV